MKKLSLELLANTVTTLRKEKNITQAALAKQTGMNRSILSRLESKDYMPSPDQLYALSQVLNFDVNTLFVEPQDETEKKEESKPLNIAVAGTGYVGLSLAVLLSQHNNVTAVGDKIIDDGSVCGHDITTTNLNSDVVEHPVHYQSYIKGLNIEAIDCMRAAFGDDCVKGFCICNA